MESSTNRPATSNVFSVRGLTAAVLVIAAINFLIGLFTPVIGACFGGPPSPTFGGGCPAVPSLWQEIPVVQFVQNFPLVLVALVAVSVLLWLGVRARTRKTPALLLFLPVLDLLAMTVVAVVAYH